MHSSMIKIAGMAILVLLVASSAFAQRRVFTNEDISTAPAAAPASPADEMPAPSPTAESTSAALPDTPMADLNQVQRIERTLKDLYDMFAVRANEAPTPELRQRWTQMNQSLGEVIRANHQTIVELQDRLGIQPDTAGSEEPANR